MTAGRHNFRFNEALDGRTGGGERSQTEVGGIVGCVVVGERADGDHVGDVARNADGHGGRTGVASRGHDDDAGLPCRHHCLIQRIIPVVGLRVGPEGDIDHAYVVLALIGDDPVQSGDHIHIATAALAVEGAHDDQVGLGRDAQVLQGQVLRATGRDGRDVRAMP